MQHSTATTRIKRTTSQVAFKFSTRVSHSCDGTPGIRRERTKTGFRFRSPAGLLIRDVTILSRIRAVVIPPAWEDVWICGNPHGHIQATGKDARGRKQYRYHPAFRASQDGAKFERLAAFGSALNRIRNRVEADLALPGLPRKKVLAAVVKLLDRTHLRVGNAEYAKANKSYGLSTMLDRHVAFVGESLRVRFRGKSGVWHDRKVCDKRLARVVRACRDIPGQHLFQYRDSDGTAKQVRSTDVNEYIREIADGPFTAKDFRTWAGTVAALEQLAKLPVPKSRTAAEKEVVRVIAQVAAKLGNTPAVCRKCYIHPQVFEAFKTGLLPRCRQQSGLSAAEQGVLKLLRSQTRLCR